MTLEDTSHPFKNEDDKAVKLNLDQSMPFTDYPSPSPHITNVLWRL